MRAKEYLVLEMAVEQGVTLGWNRAHKHVEHPDEVAIRDHIAEAVTSEICEWFTFDQPEAEP